MCSNLQVCVNMEEDDLIRQKQKKTVKLPFQGVLGSMHETFTMMANFQLSFLLTIYSWGERDKLGHREVRQLEKCLDKVNRGLRNVRLSNESIAEPQNLSKVNVGVFWSQLSCHVFAKGCINVCM